jgi:hypothetical protein
MACFVYIKLAEILCDGLDKASLYRNVQQVIHFWDKIAFPKAERCHFDPAILQILGIKLKIN